MKWIWPALLGVIRTAYLVYATWCLLFPLAVLGVLVALFGDGGAQWQVLHVWLQGIMGLLGLLATYAVARVYIGAAKGDPNPWQTGFMSWFGTLKLFRNRGGAAGVGLHWPSAFLVENPHGYCIGGAELRQVLDVLQPGDILLRGYEGYVDGEFIRRSARTGANGYAPGWYTHVALYAGELGASDRSHVPPVFQNQTDYFCTGPEMVIHSMAKGVHTEDVLTFLRCDYLAVLRLPDTLSQNPNPPTLHHLATHTKAPASPSPSDTQSAALARALEQGQSVTRNAVAQVARLSALEKIGEAYDFDCSDTKAFHRFSCAELLYYCLRGVHNALTLQAQPHALYPLAPWFTTMHMMERTTITPDDYYALTTEGRLRCVWEDAFSQALHHPKGLPP